jgi:putative Mg2+ transporter-C (MgtC) family protein
VVSTWDIVLRLLAALVLGGAIGLERERQERAAGLRTVTMVSLGSCLFTLLGIYGFANTDPSRVAAQIVTGIGFLGAGTIFLRKDFVRGLTTAATIWATAAIGMAAATAQYFAAFLTTLLVLIVLMVLKPIELRLFRRPHESGVSFEMPRAGDNVERVQAALRTIGVDIQSIKLNEISESQEHYEMDLEVPVDCTTSKLLGQLRTVEGIRSISISQELPERPRAGT